MTNRDTVPRLTWASAVTSFIMGRRSAPDRLPESFPTSLLVAFSLNGRKSGHTGAPSVERIMVTQNRGLVAVPVRWLKRFDTREG